MTKINVGLIGLGRVSQLAYLNNLSTIKKINSISICDKNLDLLSKVAKKYKIKKTYSNFLDMLKKEELDIVFVIVNRFLVEKISKKILNDDKNIILFSEKPFAQSYKKAKELVNIARKKKKDFLVGYMKRCDTGLKYIKSNINSFKLETLLHEPLTPGRLFLLNEKELAERLEAIEEVSEGALMWSETAGISEVRKTNHYDYQELSKKWLSKS